MIDGDEDIREDVLGAIEKYKVQIRASTEVIPKHKFKKLSMNVQEVVYSEGFFKYKYFVGIGSSFEDAQKIRNKVIAKGFKDAFIVKK